MRETGLRSEILVNILFITAVAMFLVGLIGFKVTERYALLGQIEGVNGAARALEEAYLERNDIGGGVGFLESIFPEGTYGVLATPSSRTPFGTHGDSDYNMISTDPVILDVLYSGEYSVELKGFYFPFLSPTESIKVVVPITMQSGQRGALLVQKPLESLKDSLFLSMRLIALWIILFLVIIGSFGFYIISRRIVKPVLELIRTTEKISEGKFPESQELGNIREINQLNESLRNMYTEIEDGKNRLKEKILELEDTNLRLQLTQKELIEAEKMASLGKLSAGVAHEIGNPLSAIRSYSDALGRIPDNEKGKRGEIIREIQGEVNRIDVIIRSLLDYSRPKNYEIGPVDVNDVVKRSVDIVSKQGLLKNIGLVTELDDRASAARADYDQLTQVLINLLLNSVDAIVNDGEIRIETSDSDTESVVIRIMDNGEGISEENQSKIFDPFYTTKDPGKGTGLGLSICQTIIRAFGGRINVESREGEGAEFRVTLQKAAGRTNAENINN